MPSVAGSGTDTRMNERDRWSLAWAGLTIASFTGFAALESLALRQPPPRPTYTRTLARWFGCHPRTRHGRLTPAAFVAASAVLAVHVARYREPGGVQP